MLTTLAGFGLRRTHRILLVVLGLALYAAFCLGLARNGFLQVTGQSFAQLLGFWILGFVILMVADKTGNTSLSTMSSRANSAG